MNEEMLAAGIAEVMRNHFEEWDTRIQAPNEFLAKLVKKVLEIHKLSNHTITAP